MILSSPFFVLPGKLARFGFSSIPGFYIVHYHGQLPDGTLDTGLESLTKPNKKSFAPSFISSRASNLNFSAVSNGILAT
jgi:hypothetical protein